MLVSRFSNGCGIHYTTHDTNSDESRQCRFQVRTLNTGSTLKNKNTQPNLNFPRFYKKECK